jgi:hypothetical protein
VIASRSEAWSGWPRTAVYLDTVFAEFGRRVRTHDVFVLFIAGHGKPEDGQYYFLPRDVRHKGKESLVQRSMGQQRWQEWLARIRTRKSILLYDTCRSRFGWVSRYERHPVCAAIRPLQCRRLARLPRPRRDLFKLRTS